MEADGEHDDNPHRGWRLTLKAWLGDGQSLMPDDNKRSSQPAATLVANI